MYQVAVEWLLGLKVQGDVFTVDPCIPPSWPGFKLRYRYQGTTYAITVSNPEAVETGVVEVSLDGNVVADKLVPLENDDGIHHVTVTMGKVAIDHVRDEFDELVSVT
jgi:cyclic beta-1,2-glucan synthetase